jgi:hypothetical protein
MSNLPRRVVTGHTAAGRSTIASDGPPEREQRMALHGVTLREIWNTQTSPAPIGRTTSEPREEGVTLAHGIRARRWFIRRGSATLDVTIEVDGESKPALIAEWLNIWII